MGRGGIPPDDREPKIPAVRLSRVVDRRRGRHAHDAPELLLLEQHRVVVLLVQLEPLLGVPPLDLVGVLDDEGFARSTGALRDGGTAQVNVRVAPTATARRTRISRVMVGWGKGRRNVRCRVRCAPARRLTPAFPTCPVTLRPVRFRAPLTAQGRLDRPSATTFPSVPRVSKRRRLATVTFGAMPVGAAPAQGPVRP